MKQFSPGWTLIKLYTFLIYLFLFAPIVVVCVLAFNPRQFGIFPMEGFSLRWFVRLMHNASIIEAFQNSLLLGSLTAVISTASSVSESTGFRMRCICRRRLAPGGYANDAIVSPGRAKSRAFFIPKFLITRV